MVVDDIIDPKAMKVRESLRMVQRAVLNGWDVPDEARNSLPLECYAIATDPERPARDKLRAMEVLRAMAKDNLDAAMALDKIERLDNPEAATERHVVKIDYGEAGRQWPRESDD